MLNRTTNVKKFLFFCGIGVFLIGIIALSPAPLYGEEKGVDLTACEDCHEDQVAAYKKSSHFAFQADCISCHGDAAKHIDDGDGGFINSFKDTETALQKTNQCLGCHKKDNGRYFASSHGKASMACTDCHSVHMKKAQPALLKKGAQKTCFACHEDVFARFNLNEKHRLQEGILTCSSCHNPHEPALRERLGGFKQEACFKCHTDKQGPFMYEHGSIRVDGCSACHEVHGSANRHMLTIQNVAELCYSCHGVVPGWHSRFTPEFNCTNCHATIHGSNFSPYFLNQ